MVRGAEGGELSANSGGSAGMYGLLAGMHLRAGDLAEVKEIVSTMRQRGYMCPNCLAIARAKPSHNLHYAFSLCYR